MTPPTLRTGALLCACCVVSVLAHRVLPWWCGIAPFFAFGLLVRFDGRAALKTFLCGCVGQGTVVFLAASGTHVMRESVLTSKLATLFALPHPVLIFFATAAFFGAAAGCAGCTGLAFKRAMQGDGHVL